MFTKCKSLNYFQKSVIKKTHEKEEEKALLVSTFEIQFTMYLANICTSKIGRLSAEKNLQKFENGEFSMKKKIA